MSFIELLQNNPLDNLIVPPQSVLVVMLCPVLLHKNNLTPRSC